MKILIIASGKTANQINDISIPEDTKIVVVNNGHLASDKWDYWVHSNDYKGNLPETLIGKEITNYEYDMAVKKFGGIKQCGYSIVLAASYWVLDALKPSEIYYLGCDMNYEPSEDGSTHFYGVGFDIATKGVPDPIKMAKAAKKGEQTEEDYIREIYLRFKGIAEQHESLVWNAAKIEQTKTRLPYPFKSLS